jgi:hypothetical protein
MKIRGPAREHKKIQENAKNAKKINFFHII